MERPNLMHKHVLTSTLVLAICTVIGSQAFSADEAKNEGPSPVSLDKIGKESVGLRVQTLAFSSIPERISTPGKIEALPALQYEQHAPLSGTIAKVYVQLGDFVKKGQTLALLQSPELNKLAAEALQSRNQVSSEIKQSEVLLNDEINQAKAKLDFAAVNYDRDKKLFEKGIASQEEVQLALSDLQVGQAKYNAALQRKEVTLKGLKEKLAVTLQPIEQRLQLLGASSKVVEKMLARNDTISSVPIRSASEGLVTEVKASAGQNIDTSSHIFTITDISRIWATAFAYQEDVADIRKGEKVNILVSAFPTEKFIGYVTFIGSQVDPQSHTLPVKTEIANPNHSLKPEMFAQLDIETNHSHRGLFLPEEAVIKRGDKSFVLKETISGYQPVEVETKKGANGLLEIKSGVEPGDRVVVHGAFPLMAQSLKMQAGDSAFSHPSGEGEAESGTAESEKTTPQAPYLLPMAAAVFIAFLLGAALTGVIMRSSKVKRM